MNSLERVLTTLGHSEPDRVPLFLLVTMHGARELGTTIQDYFSRAENVVEGQLKMRARWGHDCLYPFFYAPVEVEAWGAEVIYRPDGPPNSGRPFVRGPEDISRLEVPEIQSTPCLRKVLDAIAGLKAEAQDQAPIVGVVMSPFSLPVMQMGFEGYLQVLLEQREAFDTLMRVNEDFCVDWANAQLAAGATAICYFDPVCSPTIVPRETFLETGFGVARRTLARINGPCATHLASGRGLAIVDNLVQTGTAIVGVSSEEDLARVKAACSGRLTVLGNLNGLAMPGWDADMVNAEVRRAILAAGPGGGFILSDNHGEIPWQVPETVLDQLAAAVNRHGHYPLSLDDSP